jgi:hypothetical protein
VNTTSFPLVYQPLVICSFQAHLHFTNIWLVSALHRILYIRNHHTIVAMRHSKKDLDRDLRREAKRQGIEVNSSKYDPCTVSDIPPEHKDKFAIIQSLGRILLDNYGFTPNNETSDKPWQLKTRKRALQLSHLAARCRIENRNESGWRYEIEQRLFERFDIEVAWLVPLWNSLMKKAKYF